MKTLLISILIIVFMLMIIGVVLIYITRQMNKQIYRLFSEIEDIKNYLIIE